MVIGRQLRYCARCNHEIASPDGATPKTCPACGFRLDPSSPNNSSDEARLSSAPVPMRRSQKATAALVVGILSTALSLFGSFCFLGGESILNALFPNFGRMGLGALIPALILAVVGIMFLTAGGISGTVAILRGMRAWHEIAQSAGRADGRRMAVAGIVLGSIGLGVLFFFLISWAISLSNR